MKIKSKKHIIRDLVFSLPGRTVDICRTMINETGLSKQKIYRFIRDNRSIITATDIIAISNFFGIEPYDLYRTKKSVPGLVKKIMEDKPEIVRHTKPFKK